MNDNASKSVKQNFIKIMRLRDSIYKKGLLETMVHRAPVGTKIRFGEDRSEITYPADFAVESFLEKVGFTPRAIDAYSPVEVWNSNFQNVATETMKSLEKVKEETT